MRYEITDENVVLIFIDPQAVPVLYQPYDPAGDGSPFRSKEEAEKWAIDFIEAHPIEPIVEPPVEE